MEKVTFKDVKRKILRYWYRKKYNDSLASGREHGKFYVRYKDGQRSINMFYRTAKDYASMFGGEVIEDF